MINWIVKEVSSMWNDLGSGWYPRGARIQNRVYLILIAIFLIMWLSKAFK